MSFKIIRREDGSDVQGPFSRSKCRRLLSLMAAEEQAKLRIIETDVKLREGSGEPRIKKRKKIRESDVRDSVAAAPEIKIDPDLEKYRYRSGTFTSKESVNEVMRRLGISDYIIKVDKHSGYYSLYNEPEE